MLLFIAAVSTGTSFILSTIFTVLTFSGMQMFKPWFASSHLNTIFGGYLGARLFLYSLTAVGNLKTQVFGKASQIKLYPEGKNGNDLVNYQNLFVCFLVAICLFFAMFASFTIHRVCGTTW